MLHQPSIDRRWLIARTGQPKDNPVQIPPIPGRVERWRCSKVSSLLASDSNSQKPLATRHDFQNNIPLSQLEKQFDSRLIQAWRTRSNQRQVLKLPRNMRTQNFAHFHILSRPRIFFFFFLFLKFLKNLPFIFEESVPQGRFGKVLG